MKNIGFYGGSTIYELGTTADVELFFECLKAFVVNSDPGREWNLLTERLYCRYIKLEDIDMSAELMVGAQKIFCTKSSDSVDWRHFPGEGARTKLNPNQRDLAQVFSKFFVGFECCIKSSKLFFDKFGVYQPVRIVVSDVPEVLMEKKRPLKEYDDLVGMPFWLR